MVNPEARVAFRHRVLQVPHREREVGVVEQDERNTDGERREKRQPVGEEPGIADGARAIGRQGDVQEIARHDRCDEQQRVVLGRGAESADDPGDGKVPLALGPVRLDQQADRQHHEEGEHRVGSAEVRVACVNERQRQKQRSDQARRVAPQTPADAEHHVHRRRAERGGERA